MYFLREKGKEALTTWAVLQDWEKVYNIDTFPSGSRKRSGACTQAPSISVKYLKEKGRVAYGTQYVLVRLGEGSQPWNLCIRGEKEEWSMDIHREPLRNSKNLYPGSLVKVFPYWNQPIKTRKGSCFFKVHRHQCKATRNTKKVREMEHLQGTKEIPIKWPWVNKNLWIPWQRTQNLKETQWTTREHRKTTTGNKERDTWAKFEY